VCLSKESGNIRHGHQFQVVECHDDEVVIWSYEVPLRDAGSPRDWVATPFKFPYTRDHDENFVTAMQSRLSSDLNSKAEYELRRFNACVNFEELLRGNRKLQGEILAGLVKLLSPVSSGEIRTPYERRLDQLRADPAQAKDERKELHRWLNKNHDGLETYLALTWEWPPIDEPTR
jgi:hypothetical protein